MQLIENWKQVAKASYVMWLWYIMSLCMAVLATINADSWLPVGVESYVPLADIAEVIPDAVQSWLNVWLLRIILACSFLVGPGRMLPQASISPKPPQ